MARSSTLGGTVKTLRVADGADLSVPAKQYTFVKATANQRVNTCGAGQGALGVMMQLAVGSPQSVAIRMPGNTALLKVDGTTPIVATDRLKSDASGRGVKIAAATEIANAIALESADTADVIIEVSVISPSASA
jgi:hypothetical protein